MMMICHWIRGFENATIFRLVLYIQPAQLDHLE